MSKKTDRNESEPDSHQILSNPEKETIRETTEKMRLQNSILQRIIKKIKHNPGSSGT